MDLSFELIDSKLTLLPCSLALMYQYVQEYYGNYNIVENTAILLNGALRNQHPR
jgi:hypothetical protein